MNRSLVGGWLRLFVLAAGLTAPVKGTELVLLSFDSVGSVTFNTVTNASAYRVEWAPSPGGPWMTFSAAAETLDEISATGSGVVTASVPMCYRVVASFTNDAPPDGMVFIPGGTNVGTDPDYGAYSLTVSPFYMDRFEVTKALWDEVYSWSVTNGYSYDRSGSGKGANHPVHTVNWYDVVKWCNARSQKEARTPVYYTDAGLTHIYKTDNIEPFSKPLATGYRLPTEVEWQYAARGGTPSQRFPWGDTIQHARANYESSSAYAYDTSPTRGYHPTYGTGAVPYTSPVGSFAENGYGLCDIAGNVLEWCWDASGPERVLRGGSWYLTADLCRIRYRTYASPTLTGSHYGFRAVLSLSQ